MKPYPTQCCAAALACFFCLFFEHARCQDSLSSQKFQDGVPNNSISVNTGYQSARLSWAPASFATPGAVRAGYLLIYSTSTPSLVSYPNGLAPDYAVLNGTVVPVAESELPNEPMPSAIASGMADGTSYNFLIVAYVWDGINKQSYKYSSPTTTCAAIPPDVPENIELERVNLSSYSISGQITGPLSMPTGYLGFIVLFSRTPLSQRPVDGTVYRGGDAIGEDTVSQSGSDLSFNTLTSGHKLSPSTTYYINVFSYTISACIGGPVYSSGSVDDSLTTADTVQRDQGESENITLAPNPSADDAALHISSPVFEEVQLMIYSSDGKLAWKKVVLLQLGANTVSLDTQVLPKGIYFITGQRRMGKYFIIPFIKQ